MYTDEATEFSLQMNLRTSLEWSKVPKLVMVHT
jgi:hypothetical protein